MAQLTRREFVVMAAAASPGWLGIGDASAADAAPGNELAGLTIAEASRRIHAHELTSTELTQAVLKRIDVYNPKINAYITVMHQEALAQAAQLDSEAKAGKFRSPLHGVPIALKDNIDTAGTRTTGGSAVFRNRIPDEDAQIAQRLKASGAIVIGKLNRHEFARGCTGDVSYFGP